MKFELLIILLMIPFVMVDVFAEPTLKHSEFSVETFVDGLSFPTSMGFIEDKVIVLEKNSGQVRLIDIKKMEEINTLLQIHNTGNTKYIRCGKSASPRREWPTQIMLGFYGGRGAALA